MSHESPVPPGNQSPYPIDELPHAHPALLPPVVEKQRQPRALLIGGAIATVGVAALGGLGAFLLGRRNKPGRGRRKT